MVALTVGTILLSVATGIFFQSIRFGESLIGKTTLNEQAREIFSIAALGGAQKECVNDSDAPPSCAPDPTDNTSLLDDHDYLFGLRGRSRSLAQNDSSGFSAPDNTDSDPSSVSAFMAQDNASDRLYRFVLPPSGQARPGSAADTAPDYSLLSSEIAATTVTCTEEDTSSGSEITRIGYPVQGCSTVGEEMTVRGYLRADPHFALEGAHGSLTIDLFDSYAIKRRDDADLDVRARYWNGFTLNVD